MRLLVNEVSSVWLEFVNHDWNSAVKELDFLQDGKWIQSELCRICVLSLR